MWMGIADPLRRVRCARLTDGRIKMGKGEVPVVPHFRKRTGRLADNWRRRALLPKIFYKEKAGVCQHRTPGLSFGVRASSAGSKLGGAQHVPHASLSRVGHSPRP